MGIPLLHNADADMNNAVSGVKHDMRGAIRAIQHLSADPVSMVEYVNQLEDCALFLEFLCAGRHSLGQEVLSSFNAYSSMLKRMNDKRGLKIVERSAEEGAQINVSLCESYLRLIHRRFALNEHDIITLKFVDETLSVSIDKSAQTAKRKTTLQGPAIYIWQDILCLPSPGENDLIYMPLSLN